MGRRRGTRGEESMKREEWERREEA